MSTFKERIDWILANRPLFRGSVSRLSIAAGMNRTSLAKTVERSEANKGIQKMEDHNLRTGDGSPSKRASTRGRRSRDCSRAS